MKPKLSKISRKGKFLFLAYDQGIEHGPTDFNDENVDPKYVLDIAKRGKFTAIIFQKGIVEKYSEEIEKLKIPLVIKLNGKTNLVKGDPISTQLTSVSEAVKLGAVAVGYTIYLGSIHEPEMLREFENIEREAHKRGLPIIVWMYPRGKSVEGKSKTELMAYATRVALEIGADVVKIEPSGNLKDLAWAVKAAGKVKVVSAGGHKEDERELIKRVKIYTKAGFSGMAIGRNVWQSKDPIKIANKLKKIIWG